MMYSEDCAKPLPNQCDPKMTLPDVGMAIVNSLEKLLAIQTDTGRALGKPIEDVQYPNMNCLSDCMNLILVLADKNCEAARTIHDSLV